MLFFAVSSFLAALTDLGPSSYTIRAIGSAVFLGKTVVRNNHHYFVISGFDSDHTNSELDGPAIQ